MENFKPFEAKTESNSSTKVFKLLQAFSLGLGVVAGGYGIDKASGHFSQEDTTKIESNETEFQQKATEIFLKDGGMTVVKVEAMRSMMEKLRPEPISFTNSSGETVTIEMEDKTWELYEKGFEAAIETLELEEKLTVSKEKLAAINLEIVTAEKLLEAETEGVTERSSEDLEADIEYLEEEILKLYETEIETVQEKIDTTVVQ